MRSNQYHPSRFTTVLSTAVTSLVFTCVLTMTACTPASEDEEDTAAPITRVEVLPSSPTEIEQPAEQPSGEVAEAREGAASQGEPSNAEAPSPYDPDHPFAHTGLTPASDFTITVADMDPDSTAFHIEFEMGRETAAEFTIDSDLFLLYGGVKLHVRGLDATETRRDDDGAIEHHRFRYTGAVQLPLRPTENIPVAVLLDNKVISEPSVWQAGDFAPVR